MGGNTNSAWLRSQGLHLPLHAGCRPCDRTEGLTDSLAHVSAVNFPSNFAKSLGNTSPWYSLRFFLRLAKNQLAAPRTGISQPSLGLDRCIIMCLLRSSRLLLPKRRFRRLDSLGSLFVLRNVLKFIPAKKIVMAHRSASLSFRD